MEKLKISVIWYWSREMLTYISAVKWVVVKIRVDEYDLKLPTKPSGYHKETVT
jgi:hypothetical protein